MLTFFVVLNFLLLALHMLWHKLDDRLYQRQQKLAADAILKALEKLSDGRHDDSE